MCTKKLDGFSLIEMSVVLLIIGIIAAGMMKGRDLVEAAQMRTVANDVQIFQIAFAGYINAYGALPGDDPNATAKFTDVENGDGDGVISGKDAQKVLSHLWAAGLLDTTKLKQAKIGGGYDVISEDDEAKLRISDRGKGSMSKKQAVSLVAKIGENIGNDEQKIEIFPKISSNETQKYMVKVKIN